MTSNKDYPSSRKKVHWKIIDLFLGQAIVAPDKDVTAFGDNKPRIKMDIADILGENYYTTRLAVDDLVKDKVLKAHEDIPDKYDIPRVGYCLNYENLDFFIHLLKIKFQEHDIDSETMYRTLDCEYVYKMLTEKFIPWFIEKHSLKLDEGGERFFSKTILLFPRTLYKAIKYDDTPSQRMEELQIALKRKAISNEIYQDLLTNMILTDFFITIIEDVSHNSISFESFKKKKEFVKLGHIGVKDIFYDIKLRISFEDLETGDTGGIKGGTNAFRDAVEWKYDLSDDEVSKIMNEP
ncbi:MAG: hypothetical protein KKH41_01480 [Candidatus Thermoplasmatota archaeon]|nr:hypothetical protein [Euryarchaeota archaeon]MBU4031388.1 hypothetical protein [Candidatus Thermoplasmatota archaeon]MBU4145285.1 hypothetical protein [Candidatus Thermoplasmatota archaeon]MBU4591233.1 hypothetical protein [Candidatus Thermoplasmatota archaeon]